MDHIGPDNKNEPNLGRWCWKLAFKFGETRVMDSKDFEPARALISNLGQLREIEVKHGRCCLMLQPGAGCRALCSSGTAASRAWQPLKPQQPYRPSSPIQQPSDEDCPPDFVCTRDFLSLQEGLNRNKNTQQEITVGELQLWRENDRSAKLNRQPEKM